MTTTKEERREYYLKNKKTVYASHRKWAERNADSLREYRKKYWSKPENQARRRELYRKRIEHYKARDRVHYYKTKDRHRELNMAKRYKITVEEYRALFVKYNSLCGVCGKPESVIDKRNGEPRYLAVDHDHKTGKVRGLLCQKCNQAIGLLKEDTVLMERAIVYLKYA